MRPSGSPAPRAAARLNIAFGLIGAVGSDAWLMTRPGETASAWAWRPATDASISAAWLSRSSRSDSSPERPPAPASMPSRRSSADAISALTVSSSTFAAPISRSIDAVAPVSRCARYASLNATVPSCAACGVPPLKLISRTAVLGGTVTDTWETRSAAGSAPSAAAAASATSVDLTSCASVSRLTCPAVRAPWTSVSPAVGSTSTEAVDS